MMTLFQNIYQFSHELTSLVHQQPASVRVILYLSAAGILLMGWKMIIEGVRDIKHNVDIIRR